MSSPQIYDMLSFPNLSREVILNLHPIGLASYQTKLEATLTAGTSNVPRSALENQLELVKEARTRKLLGIPPDVVLPPRDILKITFEG